MELPEVALDKEADEGPGVTPQHAAEQDQPDVLVVLDEVCAGLRDPALPLGATLVVELDQVTVDVAVLLRDERLDCGRTSVRSIRRRSSRLPPVPEHRWTLACEPAHRNRRNIAGSCKLLLILTTLRSWRRTAPSPACLTCEVPVRRGQRQDPPRRFDRRRPMRGSSPPARVRAGTSGPPCLTCLTRSSRPDLALKGQEPKITIAAASGITERAVRLIVAGLEGAGHLTRVRTGRCNHYAIDAARPLDDLPGRTVGDLLELLAPRAPGPPPCPLITPRSWSAARQGNRPPRPGNGSGRPPGNYH